MLTFRTFAAAALLGSCCEAFAVSTTTEAELAAVRQKVAALRLQLGERAGEPEVPDRYTPIPEKGSRLSPAEAKGAFARILPKLEKMRWWKIGVDPKSLKHALREPASVISGCAAASRAKLDGAERGLALAREAAEFLMWAQEQAGAGLFPFPYARGGAGGKAFEAAEHGFAEAERRGDLDRMVRNGWAVDDGGGGGLQFDNAEAGAAMLELYEVTRDARLLGSAVRAADWAAARPVAANWNYNSFSVYLLAKACAVTNRPDYLAAAVRKARLGVIPGQMADGPRAGRWVDAHNAKPVYHYIMMRALAQLAAALPAADPARPEVLRALQLGLKARNSDFFGPGACDRNKALEALLLTCRTLSKEAEVVCESRSAEALEALSRLTSEEYRAGKLPLAPREWGLFLEDVAAP
jgi:hypothetical protein